jgi:hypothetical protein
MPERLALWPRQERSEDHQSARVRSAARSNGNRGETVDDQTADEQKQELRHRHRREYGAHRGAGTGHLQDPPGDGDGVHAIAVAGHRFAAPEQGE